MISDDDFWFIMTSSLFNLCATINIKSTCHPILCLKHESQHQHTVMTAKVKIMFRAVASATLSCKVVGTERPARKNFECKDLEQGLGTGDGDQDPDAGDFTGKGKQDTFHRCCE